MKNGRKVLLCVSWDHRGIIHFEFLNRNHTLTEDFYSQQWQCVHENLRKCLRHVLVNRRNVELLHDNTRLHSVIIKREKILDFGLSFLLYPSYSPDLATSDFHLFRSLQNTLNDKKCSQKDQVKTFVENFLCSKPAEFF